jgi:putative oxidoreductase
MNIRKNLTTAARLFLGLVFTVFGLNFFLHFLPTPPPAPRAAAFAGALFSSGYLFPLLKTTEVMAGLLLLSGRFVPLALAVLAPIVINIVGFHLFLAPSGVPLALAMLATELYLSWAHPCCAHAILCRERQRPRPRSQFAWRRERRRRAGGAKSRRRARRGAVCRGACANRVDLRLRG